MNLLIDRTHKSFHLKRISFGAPGITFSIQDQKFGEIHIHYGPNFRRTSILEAKKGDAKLEGFIRENIGQWMELWT